MDEIAPFIYVWAPACGALLAFIGALVIALSPKQLRHARVWFILSALPLFLLPITFVWTAHDPRVGFSVGAIAAFFLGLIYWAGISFLNERIRDDEKGHSSS